MKAKNLANQNRQSNRLVEWWQHEGWRKPARAGQLTGAQPGQALVEFALCLPFLLLLFVILVETGFLLRSHMTVVSAVGEGVRVVAARGDADPAYAFDKLNGNASSSLVGADGDLVLVQNVNTALQNERANVRLLMTYRADATDDILTAISKTNVITNTGINGIGGPYGVFYNPQISVYPFQEVFSWTNQTQPDGSVQRWFTPSVLSKNDCQSQYVGTKSYSAVLPTAPTGNGNTYPSSSGAFCGDATKADYSTGTSGGIQRRIKLGQVWSSGSNNYNNFTSINNTSQWPGSSTKCDTTGQVKYDPVGGTYDKTPIPVLRCWRANYAPWYPALRWSIDIDANNAGTSYSGANYYNNQNDDPRFFGNTSTTGTCVASSSCLYYRSPDYAGVRIDYHHQSFFQVLKIDLMGVKIAPFDLDLSDKAVKILEPTSSSPN